MIAFLRAHWKKLALVVALVAAFGAGRFATPSKVHVVSVIDTRVLTVQGAERVVYKDRIVKVDRVITKTVSPDGTITETTTDKSTRETKTADASKSTSTTNAVSSTRNEHITITDHPRFTVTLLAGAQYNPSVNLIPGVGPLSFGLQLQYRIAGPLQVGAWGLTTGAFGVSVGLTF